MYERKITMAELTNQKHYLDHAGLVALIKNIKAADAADKLALEKVIGVKNAEGTAVALTVGTGETAQTYTDMKSYVDAVIASVNGDASALTNRVKANEDAIALLNDDAETVGSVAAAVKAEADRIDAIVGTPAEGKTIQGEIEDITKEGGAIDVAVQAEADRIDGVIGDWSVPASEGVEAVAGSGLCKEIEDKLADVNSDATALEARVKANEDALGVINSTDATKEGSLAKNLADAKAYTDAAEARLLGSDELAESLNSIKDIVDYITKSDDKEGVTNLFEMVTANGAAIAAEETARKAQIGDLGKVGEGEDAADQTVKGYVDAEIAKVNSAVDGLDATVGSTTVEEGKHVAVQVVEEAGVLTGLTVTEDDIASAALLGKKDDAKTAETAFGYIAKEADRAATEEGAIRTLIGTVPASVGETATENVVDYVDAKVAAANAVVTALNATESGKDTLEQVTVTVTQAGGKITKVDVACALEPCSADDINALFDQVEA